MSGGPTGTFSMDIWVCWHFSSMISKQFSFVNGQHKMLNRRQKTMNLLCSLYLLFDSALEKKQLESSIDRLLSTINSPAEFFIAKKFEDFLFCYLLVMMKPQRSLKVLSESKHFPEIRFLHLVVCESIAFIDHVSDDDLRKNFSLASLRSETKPLHAHFNEVNFKRFGVFSFREYEFGLHSMTKYKHNEQITSNWAFRHIEPVETNICKKGSFQISSCQTFVMPGTSVCHYLRA